MSTRRNVPGVHVEMESVQNEMAGNCHEKCTTKALQKLSFTSPQ